MVLGLVHGQDCIPKPMDAKGTAPAYYRYSFLVDTSASMVGRGDGRGVIFPQLQEQLLSFVRSIRGRAEVWVTPFNQGAAPTSRFRLPEGRLSLESYISSLEASGTNTWLYRSLQKVFSEIPADPTVGNVVYILTDGVDNDPQPPSLRQVVQAYQSKRGPHDFLYYVGLGQAVPEDIQGVFASVPLACAIGTAVGVVPVFAHAQVSPAEVNLGNFKLEPGSRDVRFEVQFLGPSAPLEFLYQDTNLKQAGGQLEIEPSVLLLDSMVRFRLTQTVLLPDGNYGGYLLLSGPPGTVVTPASIPVRLQSSPGALYRLVLLESRSGVMNRDGRSVFKYRLEGNEWASQPITLAIDNLPQGLQARFNGQTGPVRIKPGQEVEIELIDQGASSKGSLNPVNWKVDAPAGARLELPSPPIVQSGEAKGFWLLAAFLALTLWGGWLWRRHRPRRSKGTPISTTEFSLPYASFLTPLTDGPSQLELKEGQIADLGLLWGNPLLRGLLLMGCDSGAQVEELPDGVRLLADEPLGVGAILPFGEPVRVYSEEGLIGSFLVVNPRRATLVRWGKATFVPHNSRPVNFDLGGLEVFDLGKKLHLPALHGMSLMLSRGGLRLLQIPAGILARIDQDALQAGNKIPFERTVRLEDVRAAPLGEITFSALEEVPEPAVCLRYMGAHPEQRRRTLLLLTATDLGLATGEAHLERLQILPLSEGIQIAHIPGHLRLATIAQNLSPGDRVLVGDSIFLLEVSKACLGVIDVVEA